MGDVLNLWVFVRKLCTSLFWLLLVHEEIKVMVMLVYKDGHSSMRMWHVIIKVFHFFYCYGWEDLGSNHCSCQGLVWFCLVYNCVKIWCIYNAALLDIKWRSNQICMYENLIGHIFCCWTANVILSFCSLSGCTVAAHYVFFCLDRLLLFSDLISF